MKSVNHQRNGKSESHQKSKFWRTVVRSMFKRCAKFWNNILFGLLFRILGLKSADISKTGNTLKDGSMGELAGIEGRVFYVIGKPAGDHPQWLGDEGWEPDIELASQFDEEKYAKEYSNDLSLDIRVQCRIYAVQGTYTFEAGRPLKP